MMSQYDTVTHPNPAPLLSREIFGGFSADFWGKKHFLLQLCPCRPPHMIQYKHFGLRPPFPSLSSHISHSALSLMDGGQRKAIKRQKKPQEEGCRCHNKERGTKHTTQGNWVADNTTRRGEHRTQYKAIG